MIRAREDDRRTGDSPELSERLSDIYLRTMFDLVAQRPYEHLHWGLWRGVPLEPERLGEAQQAYADHIVNLIPDEVRSVVDVGCGLGGISRQICATGRKVTAITPRRDHADKIGGGGFTVLTGRFEDLEPAADADLLVFAESWNFFADVDAALELARRWLVPRGLILAADIMTEATVSRLKDAGTLLHVDDISADVQFTVDALQDRLDRFVRPYRRGLLEALSALDPSLADAVMRELERVPNEALRALLNGRLAEVDMLRDRRYRVVLLRLDQPQK